MDPVISTIICTYNHSTMLEACLESLISQTLDKGKYEIIVVDNNSTDDTAKVVKEFSANSDIRYLLEEKQGLSYARNCGLKEAAGQFLAYIDDDARAASDWLEIAHELICTSNPPMDCLGGPYHPFYTSSKPDWFEDKYEIRSLGDAPRYLQRKEYISGSNMIWSKESLNMIGGFSINSGVVGNQLRLGEETNAIDKLWSARGKPRIYFSPELLIYHWVPPQKMTLSYRFKRRYAEGIYVGLESKSNNETNRIKQASKFSYQFIKLFFRFLLRFNSHAHWQNWVVEDGSKLFHYMGCLLGLIGINPKISNYYTS